MLECEKCINSSCTYKSLLVELLYTSLISIGHKHLALTQLAEPTPCLLHAKRGHLKYPPPHPLIFKFWREEKREDERLRKQWALRILADLVGRYYGRRMMKKTKPSIEKRQKYVLSLLFVGALKINCPQPTKKRPAISLKNTGGAAGTKAKPN